jgi:hypothetical protein
MSWEFKPHALADAIPRGPHPMMSFCARLALRASTWSRYRAQTRASGTTSSVLTQQALLP